MRLILPHRKLRAKAVHLVQQTFDTEDVEELREAALIVTTFYKLKPARIQLRRKMKFRNDAGRCWEDGRVWLAHPAMWKVEGRPRDEWVSMVLHELGHYVLWADAETKADTFASRWRKDAA